jgi:hypothetical protein
VLLRYGVPVIMLMAVLTVCGCIDVSLGGDMQGPAFNVTHFESRITHLLYTARNTTEHG